MADLSRLNNLKETEPLNVGDDYPATRASKFQLPPKGEYTLQAPPITDESFGETKAGYLSAQIDPTIVDGPFTGFQLRYQKVSAKPFDRSGIKVSQAGDYLRACGFNGNLASVQDIADAVQQTEGTNYRAILDWRAYHTSGFELEGMERFPKNPDGTHQSWIEVPGVKDDEGNPARAMARLFIRKFIAE